jgi:hypothetical protein
MLSLPRCCSREPTCVSTFPRLPRLFETRLV